MECISCRHIRRRENGFLSSDRKKKNRPGSGIPVKTIGLVEADGSGIAVSEQREIDAVHRLWGEHRPGGPLVAMGSVAPIKGLTVDVGGAGTIDGFEFASSSQGNECTLNVENLPDEGATLPGAYPNCTGLDNVAGWSLKLGGEATKRYRIAYSNGAISVLPVGTVILLR